MWNGPSIWWRSGCWHCWLWLDLTCSCTLAYSLAGIPDLALFYCRRTPEEAFRLIPLGYLSFLMLIILLIWLMTRLDIVGWRAGLVFGLKVGALIWGALRLGLLSISTASPILLLGWFLGQTVELGITGMVLGSGLASDRLRSLLAKVVVFLVVTVVLAIIFQNIGNSHIMP